MAIKKVTSVKFWTELGKDVRDLYKDYIFEKGHSVYDGDWGGGSYSPEYEKATSIISSLSSIPTDNLTRPSVRPLA